MEVFLIATVRLLAELRLFIQTQVRGGRERMGSHDENRIFRYPALKIGGRRAGIMMNIYLRQWEEENLRVRFWKSWEVRF